MRRGAGVLLAWLVSAPAYGMGFGTTAQVTGFDFGAFGFGFGFLPTLDLYPSENLVLQIHALDTLAFALADDDVLFLGADLTTTVVRVDALDGTDGVIQPGGSLDIYDDFGTWFVVGGVCRFGIEGGGTMRVGAYIVPGLGLAAGDGDEEVAFSGSVQLSMWFGSAGRGGGER